MTGEEAGIKAGLIISSFLLAEKSPVPIPMTLMVVSVEDTQGITIVFKPGGSPVTFLFNSKFARFVASLWVNEEAPWNKDHSTERAEEYAQAFIDAADAYDRAVETGGRPAGVTLN